MKNYKITLSKGARIKLDDIRVKLQIKLDRMLTYSETIEELSRIMLMHMSKY